MAEHLKPCPFCGSEAKLYGTDTSGYLHCSNDRCPVQPSIYAKKIGYRGKLSDAWNARSAPDAFPEAS